MKKTLSFSLALVPVLSLLLACALPAAAQVVDPFERDKLSLYRGNGETEVVLAIAARDGAAQAVADLVGRHGGRVDFIDREVDYVTAVLSIGAVDGFLADAPVQSVEFDNVHGRYGEQLYGFESPPWTPGAEVVKPTPLASAVQRPRPDWPQPLPAVNLERAHDILEDMDGVAFRRRHPGNDGRGVVIAHVEWFPDFLLPELQTALDAEGRPIPKFLDVVNIPAVAPTRDPDTGIAGEFWSPRLSAPIRATGGRLVHERRTYRVPRDGEYRITRLRLHGVDAGTQRFHEILQRVRAEDATATVSKGDQQAGFVVSHAVLWSDRDRLAWIDTDQDLDFSDETPVGLYRETQTFGILGKDDPTTPERETLAYALQKEGDFLSFNIGLGSHAAMVAGAAAANRAPGGRIDGVAPAAQLLLISGYPNASIASFGRALITAFSDPRVDVVLLEGHLHVTGMLRRVKDGRSVNALVLSRLQKRYAKPAFFTANNMHGMGTVMDAAIVDDVIAVGAYQSAESVYANWGLHTLHADDLHIVGSEGPTADGRLKPDLLAPATPMSLFVGYRANTGMDRRDGIFALPPGYAICSGTSCATPVAAGAAALLVGAAKREGLPVDAASIHRALRESSRNLPRFDVYKQGHGLLQVDAAWRYLRSMEQQGVQAAEVEKIEVVAPVRTAVSDLLQTPGTGVGLFEQVGWSAQTRQAREITLVRRTGPREPVRYRLSWTGEQNAFDVADSVVLPLDQPVVLPVRIAVQEPRVYSAMLHLRRDGLEGDAAMVPMTVVVPLRFEVDNGYQIKERFELDRPGRRSLFLQVPEGTELLRISGRSPRDRIELRLHAPDGQFVDFVSIQDQAGSKGRFIARPVAGVWQLVVVDSYDARAHDWSVPHDAVLPRSAVEVDMSVHAVDTQVGADGLALRNRYAAFEGGLQSTPLAAWREQELVLDAGTRVEREIDVPEGTELLWVETVATGDDGQEVDLHLFDCSDVDKDCALARRIDASGHDKQVAVEHPAAGRWKVVMVAGGGKASVRYGEALASPVYGRLSVDDVVAQREPEQAWSVAHNAWRRQVPPSGYTTAAVLRVGISGALLAGRNTETPGVRKFEAAAALRAYPLSRLGPHGASTE